MSSQIVPFDYLLRQHLLLTPSWLLSPTLYLEEWVNCNWLWKCLKHIINTNNSINSKYTSFISFNLKYSEVDNCSNCLSILTYQKLGCCRFCPSPSQLMYKHLLVEDVHGLELLQSHEPSFRVQAHPDWKSRK